MIFLSQVASYKKLIKVDWNKVKEEREKLGNTMSSGMAALPYTTAVSEYLSLL